MSELSQDQKLKHFQLALSMVGISTNLMTCELIQSMAELVNAKGPAFNLGDATTLAETIQKKYAVPQMMPPGMAPMGSKLPPEIQDLVDKGQIMTGKAIDQPPSDEK